MSSNLSIADFESEEVGSLSASGCGLTTSLSRLCLGGIGRREICETLNMEA